MSLILAWLARNWRLVAYGVAAAAALWMALLVRHWHEDSKALPVAQAALKAEVACAAGSKCAERQAALVARQQVVSETVVRGYQDEIEALRNRPVPRPVRLRCTARDVGMPGADAAGPADGTGPPAGIVSAEIERPVDVAALYGLAAEADEVAARLRGLQGWNRALSAASQPPTPPATR